MATSNAHRCTYENSVRGPRVCWKYFPSGLSFLTNRLEQSTIVERKGPFITRHGSVEIHPRTPSQYTQPLPPPAVWFCSTPNGFPVTATSVVFFPRLEKTPITHECCCSLETSRREFPETRFPLSLTFETHVHFRTTFFRKRLWVPYTMIRCDIKPYWR